RAFHVTGVQTCALPIWRLYAHTKSRRETTCECRCRSDTHLLTESGAHGKLETVEGAGHSQPRVNLHERSKTRVRAQPRANDVRRPEERRVGKGGASREG